MTEKTGIAAISLNAGSYELDELEKHAKAVAAASGTKRDDAISALVSGQSGPALEALKARDLPQLPEGHTLGGVVSDDGRLVEGAVPQVEKSEGSETEAASTTSRRNTADQG